MKSRKNVKVLGRILQQCIQPCKHLKSFSIVLTEYSFITNEPKAVLHPIMANGIPAPAVTKNLKFLKKLTRTSVQIKLTSSERKASSSVTSNNNGVAASLANAISEWTWRDVWRCKHQDNEKYCDLHTLWFKNSNWNKNYLWLSTLS